MTNTTLVPKLTKGVPFKSHLQREIKRYMLKINQNKPSHYERPHVILSGFGSKLLTCLEIPVQQLQVHYRYLVRRKSLLRTCIPIPHKLLFSQGFACGTLRLINAAPQSTVFNCSTIISYKAQMPFSPYQLHFNCIFLAVTAASFRIGPSNNTLHFTQSEKVLSTGENINHIIFGY